MGCVTVFERGSSKFLESFANRPITPFSKGQAQNADNADFADFADFADLPLDVRVSAF